MANNAADPCGPVHLSIGCGGNREGAAFDYRQPSPDWSAFRESSFGIGTLKVVNATHARLHWHRTACESFDGPGHESFNSSCRSMEPLPEGAPAPQQEGQPLGQEATRLVHEDGSGFSWVKSEGAWIVRSVARHAASQCRTGGPSDPSTATAAAEHASAASSLAESGQVVEERGEDGRTGLYVVLAQVLRSDAAGSTGNARRGGWTDSLAAHGHALVLCLFLGGLAGLARLSGLRMWKRVVDEADPARELEEARVELLEGTAASAGQDSMTTRYVRQWG